MNSSLSPSTSMTDGQIGKILELIGAALRKHRTEFSKEAVQTVLAKDGAELQEDVLDIFRSFVEFRTIVVRTVMVKYGRAPQDAIAATGHALCYPDSKKTVEILAGMPRDGSEDKMVALSLFHLRGDPIFFEEDMKHAYSVRGLKPADPYALAALVESNPGFLNIATYWQDGNGVCCHILFEHTGGELEAEVHHDRIWGSGWFAGVPVEKSQDSST